MFDSIFKFSTVFSSVKAIELIVNKVLKTSIPKFNYHNMSKQYRYCFKEKKLVEISAQNHSFSSQNGKDQAKTIIHEINFEGDSCKLLTDSGAIYKNWNDFAVDLPIELISLNLTEKNYEKVMNLFIGMMEYSKQICSKLVLSKCKASENAIENIELGSNHILNDLKKIDTAGKLKKVIEKNPRFVAPIEKSIGLKWKNPKISTQTNIPDHGLTQSTFQYVPITNTIKMLFSNQAFVEQYIKYNRHEKHKCVPGIYKDICCGSVQQSKDIFEDPMTLQLQIGTDDFEVCCPLKSKATKHKVNATYVQIKNMPVEYRSKLDQIFLVALCGSANFKSQEYNYNHIAELIVDDIHKLETEGLKIGEETIKAALVNIACDNLGANSVAGFVECFVANFFCRFCECSKSECQTMVTENKRKLRTKPTYAIHVNKAEEMMEKPDYTLTKGVKRKCKFNDLDNFHVLDNMAVDVMHDINEGVIAYCIQEFLNLIVNKKIITLSEIQQRVRDFNYGSTYKYNKPSLINLEKHNLNQNAAQLYCLMIHLPFILLDMKEKLIPYWQPVETLLQCMQIIYSSVITDRDIKLLEKYIKQHLTAFMKVFNRNLSPKHHFLIHYPGYIRKMGPLIHLWTMRLEAKHKTLTEIAKRKMNFINITKTLATEHQRRICKSFVQSTTIRTSINFGNFKKTMQFKKFESVIHRDVGPNMNDIRVHKFAAFDTIEYREGCLLIENDRIYEILHILSINSKVYFICQLFKTSIYNQFCNSIEIDKNNDSIICLCFDSLENRMVYNRIYAENKNFIIADKLNIAKLI